MRKRLIPPPLADARSHAECWLDVERAAVVEFTSEDKNRPVESAFSGGGQGWRAETPGPQTIRLVFDQPQCLQRISLVFEENEITRTQQFTLRYLANGEDSFREIVRQQWNFNPPETVREVEEYRVKLSGVTVLELVIDPNISGGNACASLNILRLC